MEENIDTFPCFVADTSFMAAYLLNGICDDELSDCVKDIEYIITHNGQIHVPQLFWYEIGNALLCRTRRRNSKQIPLSKADARDLMFNLQQLPIVTDIQSTGEIRQRIFDLASENGLTYYDASYLELARRLAVPLKTYDKRLQGA